MKGSLGRPTWKSRIGGTVGRRPPVWESGVSLQTASMQQTNYSPQKRSSEFEVGTSGITCPGAANSDIWPLAAPLSPACLCFDSPSWCPQDCRSAGSAFNSTLFQKNVTGPRPSHVPIHEPTTVAGAAWLPLIGQTWATRPPLEPVRESGRSKRAGTLRADLELGWWNPGRSLSFFLSPCWWGSMAQKVLAGRSVSPRDLQALADGGPQ
ncbi:uncharacterized protein LOC131489283 [Neofelis nebulosa]|uniref:uncharacterized protein LOC131489283 n=1 Tax=Neofelis nebulosa TaxID=61452 RepID=UPI002729B4C5|nr:uncharacterized protein LOC131489283 [Neofelis nebulosa]